MSVVQRSVRVFTLAAILLLATAGIAVAQTFAAAAPYPSSSGNVGMAAADVNHDNHLDLVVPGPTNGYIRVYFGTAAGVLGSPSDFPTGTVAAAAELAVADFNGDGHPDIAAVGPATNHVSILLGNGAGAFATASSVPVGNAPSAIAAADFSGDGIVDLAVANRLGASISVLLGTGAGTFIEAPGSPLPTGSLPLALRAGDVNFDGALDLLTADHDAGTVTLYLNAGGGTFTPAAGASGLNNPVDLVVFDADNDGFGDRVVVSCQGDDTIQFFTFDVDLGTLVSAGGDSTGFDTGGLGAGDFNGDAFPDLAVVNRTAGSVQIVLGNGGGGFSPGSTVSTGSPAPWRVLTADFNNDGKPDLAVDHPASTVVLLNTSCCTIAVAVNGAGLVTSSPGGILCGDDCTMFAGAGTNVTLFAEPAAGSVLSTWSVGGCGSTSVCVYSVSTDDTITATFDPVVLTLTPSALPGGTVGVPYTQGFTMGGNGSGAYTVNYVFLPPGLDLTVDEINPNQFTIAGTPTQGGTIPFMLTLSDVDTGTNTEIPLTLTVAPASSTTFVTPASVSYSGAAQTVTLTAAIGSGVLEVNSGTVTFTVRDGSSNQIGVPATSGPVTGGSATANYLLPAGTPVQLLTITAVFNGLPTYAASSSTAPLTIVPAGSMIVPVDAAAAFSSASQIVPLTAGVTSSDGPINAGSVMFIVRTASLAVVGAPVTANVAAGTATALYTLPGGTPTQTLFVTAVFDGTSNFTGGTGDGHLTVGCGAFQILPDLAPPLRVGQPFSMTLSAPRFADAQFQIFVGTLPPGITLNGATLSGTPTASGQFSVTVVGTSAGSGGCGSSRVYTLYVRGRSLLVTGAGGTSPRVRTFDADGSMAASFLAEDPAYAGGVRVAMGDITGDGVDEVITANGRNAAASTVRVFDGVTGAEIRRFDAYPYASPGGTYVASGDVNGDGLADVITGRDGAPPEVKAFDGRTGAVIADFLAYPQTTYGGVRVAAGDIDGDGFAEIITAPAPGVAPEVRIYAGTGEFRTSFMAYSPFFVGGVFVAAGDIDGDGRADIVTGADAGGGPHVMAFSGADRHVLRSFFAYSAFFTGGVRVAAGDVNGDGRAEIVTAAGPGGGPHVRVWDGASGAEVIGFFAFESTFADGVFVAAPSAQSRMEIGVPAPGATVPPVFNIGGWAAMAGATADSGVDAIHAWLLPLSGGAAIFGGATTTGVFRPDVAALLGGNFANSGFNLSVGAVPAGSYDLVVYAHSSISGTWACRRIVRIVVTP
jgi:hypothetical protein